MQITMILISLVFAAGIVLTSPTQDALTFDAWPKEHSKSLNSIDYGADFDRAAFRDSSFVVTGSQDGTAIVWDLGKRTVRHRLVHAIDVPAARLMVNQVRVSRDGRKIAVGGANGHVTIWDPRTGSKLHDLQQHTGRISDVGWTTDGRKLAACDDDGKVVVWDADSGAVLKQFAPDEGDSVISALAVSPDGTTLVFSTRGNKAYFVNMLTGGRITVVLDLAQEPFDMEFSPDGRWLAVAEQQNLVIRNGIDGKKVRGFSGHAGDIRGFRWTRDSERMYTAGDSGEVFEWNFRTSTMIARGKVAQYVNDIALCMVEGIERVALAKPSGVFELQK